MLVCLPVCTYLYVLVHYFLEHTHHNLDICLKGSGLSRLRGARLSCRPLYCIHPVRKCCCAGDEGYQMARAACWRIGEEDSDGLLLSGAIAMLLAAASNDASLLHSRVFLAVAAASFSARQKIDKCVCIVFLALGGRRRAGGRGFPGPSALSPPLASPQVLQVFNMSTQSFEKRRSWASSLSCWCCRHLC